MTMIELEPRSDDADTARLHLADGGVVDVQGDPAKVHYDLERAAEHRLRLPMIADTGMLLVIDPTEVERVR